MRESADHMGMEVQKKWLWLATTLGQQNSTLAPIVKVDKGLVDVGRGAKI